MSGQGWVGNLIQWSLSIKLILLFLKRKKMMSLRMEQLVTQRQKLTGQLKELHPTDPEYSRVWDDRVDIIHSIIDLQKEEGQNELSH